MNPSWTLTTASTRVEVSFRLAKDVKMTPPILAVDMSKFRSFINGFPYDAWKSGVHYEYPEDSCVL